MSAAKQVTVCCDMKGCPVCSTQPGKSAKRVRNALWLGGWTREKKRDKCPAHNPHRNEYQRRRTSAEFQRRRG
jgi:hypothetical protein